MTKQPAPRGTPALAVTAAGVVVAATLVACTRDGAPPTAEPGPELSATSWRLESYGAPGAQTAVLAGTELTLTFDASGKGLGGSGGCNSFGGTYESAGNSIRVRDVVSTLMACEPRVTDQEAAYLGALDSATGYEVGEGRLTIAYSGGVLNFVAQ